MTRVKERQAQLASIRKLPISAKLLAVLEGAAAAAGVDVTVYSGGQEKAPSKKRTGSARHDNGNAADVWLTKGGRELNFDTASDRPTVSAFVTACVKIGATGIGAAADYMGPTRLHVGFGARATWGAAGKAANAPKWLRDAYAKGAK